MPLTADSLEAPTVDLPRLQSVVSRLDTVRANGLVTQVIGLVVESAGPAAQVGEICTIRPGGRNARLVKAEVVGFKQNRVLLMPLGEMAGIKPGSEVIASGESQHVKVGDHLLGRVLDGLGDPIDGKGTLGTGRVKAVPDQCRPAGPADPSAHHRAIAARYPGD